MEKLDRDNIDSIHRDFRAVFYKNEGKELLGKNYRNFWFLILILFITYTAIGFASGSLKYLKKKMDDPFINWVNVNIPYGMSQQGQRIKDLLNRDTVAKNKYHFNNVTAYFRYPIAFQSLKAKGTIEVIGRSIDIHDPILKEIFKKKNKITGRPFKDENDISIIVTKEFLTRFGYDVNTPVINMSVALGYDEQEYVPVPVTAVLKELPGMTMFATTPYFRQLKKEPARGNPFRPDGTKGEIILFIPGDTTTGDILMKKVKDFFKSRPEYKKVSPWVTKTKNDQSYQTGYNISISFIGDLDQIGLDTIYTSLVHSEELKKWKDNVVRFYNYKTYQVYNYTNYDFLAINFSDLSLVRKFKDYFYKEYKLRIDIAQIEAKENYNYVSKLTLIISFLLIIFSVLVISLFISNLLSRHLDKIKKNIGTFKAFGLSNTALLGIYFTLTSWFVISAMVIAFLLSLVFGLLGGIREGLLLVNATIEPGEPYFELFNQWISLSTGMILLVSMVVIYLTASSILKRTPGDLIYDRQ